MKSYINFKVEYELNILRMNENSGVSNEVDALKASQAERISLGSIMTVFESISEDFD